jgi:hypothetical protein
VIDRDPVRRLTDLRNGLLKLHKAMLESEKALYERDIERIPNVGRYLELVVNDPWFAWLRELSGLVVLIDEAMAADEPLRTEDADRFISESRALLTPAENGSGFANEYFKLLQRDPNVVMAHSEMMKTLSSVT